MIVIVLCLFLTVPWVDLQCMIVVFPDHTHLLCNESISFKLLQPCSHNVQSKMITCLTPEVEPLKSGGDVAYGIGLDNVQDYEKFSKAATSLKIFPDPNVTVDTRIKFRNSFDQKIIIKVSKLVYYNSRNTPNRNSLL